MTADLHNLYKAMPCGNSTHNDEGGIVNWKEFLASPQACIIALAAVFIAVRLFAPTPFYYVGADEARYLALAHNFPYHTMHGGTLFLQHMPMYPYLIAITNFVLQNDAVAGLFVSFAMGLLLLGVMIKGFRNLNKSNTWLFLFTILFALNWALVEFSRILFKETTYMVFFWAAVVFYWFGIRKSEKWFWASGIAAVLAAFSSDQVIFLFPILLLTLFIMPPKKIRWKAFVPIVLGGLAYAFWLGIRLQFYLTHVAAPIGVDGIIENTSPFGLGQILSPFSFPESLRLTQAEFTLDIPQMASAIGYLFDTYPFLITPNLAWSTAGELLKLHNIAFMLIWYLPLVALFAIWLWKTAKKNLKERQYKGNIDLLFFAYLVLLVIPMFTGVGVMRHIILSIIPVLYFETQALFMLFNKFMEKQPVRIGFVILSALFIVFWIIAHPHFTLGSQKIVQGYEVANELRSMQGDGIFVQTGYSMELDYLLPEKRVYGIVSDSTSLQKYIKDFNISYLVLGSKTWAPADEPSLDFIRSHPDLFTPIKTVSERYPINNVEPDSYTIYKVN